MKKRIWGLILLVVIIAGAGFYMWQDSQKKEEVNITGLIGGEKIGLVESDNFKKDIKDDYNLTFDYSSHYVND